MQVQEITPGLWRWTAWHPDWKEDVGCVYYEGHDAIVLIDPLVPGGEEERFWRALDRDVVNDGRPAHVLVSIYWHARSARAVVERYGGRLWANGEARAPTERRTGLQADLFRPGDGLPGGVEAVRARGSEVAFWVPAEGTLVVGDVLLGADGGLRLCPESWHPHGGGHAQVRKNLRPLLNLPVERVLVSHGEPVLAKGRAALEKALRA